MLRDERVEYVPTWAREEKVDNLVARERRKPAGKHDEIDRELRRIAKQRAGLDIEEARWLREGEQLGIWQQLGYTTAVEYLEDVFGHSPRTALDRLRVAKELGALKQLEAEVERGDLPYSAARELTRVMTPKTEAAWLAHARGKPVSDIQAMVKGREKGDLPETPSKPELVKHRVMLELSDRYHAMLIELRTKWANECNMHLDDEQFVEMMYRRELESQAPDEGKASRPAHLIVLAKCEDCQRAWQHGPGARVQLTQDELECAECDALTVDERGAKRGKPRSTIPKNVRDEVWRRDQGRCRFPGCRSKRHLDVHHIVWRILGGGNDPSNLMVLCAGHHRMHHRGIISITGRAPDQLVFARGGEPVVDSRAPMAVAAAGELCPRSRFDDVATLERATQALIELGFKKRQARDLVKQARAHVSTNADIPTIVKAVLAMSRSEEPRGGDIRADATQAMVQLGYPRPLAAAAVEEARAHVSTDDLPALIKEALRRCSTG